MQRPTAALLAACLLGVSAVPVIAQDQPAPSAFAGRVEVPEHGFAVTLRAPWVALDPSDPRVEGYVGIMAEAEPPLVLSASEPEQYCIALSGALERLSFDDVVRLILRGNETREETSAVEGPIAVDLPTGPAVRFDLEQGPEPRSPVAQYLADGGDRFLSINCVGHVRPDDDWLSIAHDFEWIPLRYEHDVAGVSISWPIDWTVTEFESPSDSGGIIYGAMGAGSMCTLVDEGLFRIGGQGDRSLEAVVAAWQSAQSLGPEVEVSRVHTSVERALRLDGDDQTMYFMVSGETIISLACQAMPPSPVPPEDRWFSIAEAIEFLPNDE